MLHQGLKIPSAPENILEHRSPEKLPTKQYQTCTVHLRGSKFCEVPSETLINVAVLIQDQFHKHKDLVNKIVTPSQR